MGLWQVFSLAFLKGCSGAEPEPAPPAQPIPEPSKREPTSYTLDDSDNYKNFVWTRAMTVVCPQNSHCLFRVGNEVKAVNAGDSDRQFQLPAGTTLQPQGVRQPPPEHHQVRGRIPAGVVDSLRGAPIRSFMDAHGMENWGATNPNNSISDDNRSFRLTFLSDEHATRPQRNSGIDAFREDSFCRDFEAVVNRKLEELKYRNLRAVVTPQLHVDSMIEVSLVPRSWKPKGDLP